MTIKRATFSYMIHNIFSPLRRILGGVFALFILGAALAFSLMLASPAIAAEPSSGPLPIKLNLSGNAFEINTSTQSIPENGTFSWEVSYVPSEKARSAQVVFEVRRNNNSLIFKRTQYLNDISTQREAFLSAQTDEKSGSATGSKKPSTQDNPDPTPLKPYIQTLDFSRELAGLSMSEGAYNISVEVTVDSGSIRETAVLNSTQFVYNPKTQPLQTVLGIRFSLPPLRDPEGIFTSDPSGGDSEALRLALENLIRVAQQRSIKPTIFLSPLLFTEWTDIANGYQVRDSSGKALSVGVDSSTVQNYATTLALFASASEAGTITRGILGYGDPDLSKFQSAGGLTLIGAHYQRAQTIYADAGFNAVHATAPLGTIIGEPQLEQLMAQDIQTVMLPSDSLSKKTAGLSLYKDKLRVLKIDKTLSARLTSTKGADTAQELLFRAYTSKDYQGNCLPLLADIKSGEDGSTLVSNIGQIAAAPWTKVFRADTVESKSVPTKLSDSKMPPLTKLDLKAEKAALAGMGVTTAIPLDNPALRLGDNGLAAQNAAPVSKLKQEAAQAIRLTYAESTIKSAEKIFADIAIQISPVTLSGNSGGVPITISNSSKTPMSVLVSLIPGPGMSIEGDERFTMSLPTQETFLEPTISLTNRVLSDFTVVVSSGPYTICEKSVDIRASYIDTIAIVAIVTLVGFGLLLYIYRRVKFSPKQGDDLRQTSE